MRVAALTDPHGGHGRATPSSPTSAAAPAGTPSSPPFCLLQTAHRVHLKQTGGRLRASLEGGIAQDVGAHVALGRGGFADDTAPAGALGRAARRRRRMGGGRDRWPRRAAAAARSRDGARRRRCDGRSSCRPAPGCARCRPRGSSRRTSNRTPRGARRAATPASSLGNGGAFGGKVTTEVGDVARRLADLHGRAVRVLFTREDVVRRGPKRPPIAAGVRADGTGIVRVACERRGSPKRSDRSRPGLVVEEVDVVGPPTTSRCTRGRLGRGGRVLAVDLAIDRDRHRNRPVTAPNGATASAVDRSGRRLHVTRPLW